MNSDHVSIVTQVYESFAWGDVPGVLANFDPDTAQFVGAAKP